MWVELFLILFIYVRACVIPFGYLLQYVNNWTDNYNKHIKASLHEHVCFLLLYAHEHENTTNTLNQAKASGNEHVCFLFLFAHEYAKITEEKNQRYNKKFNK